MGFKLRGYTRDVPQEKVRDYSLFAIATEGTEREPDYFKLFPALKYGSCTTNCVICPDLAF